MLKYSDNIMDMGRRSQAITAKPPSQKEVAKVTKILDETPLTRPELLKKVAAEL